MLVPQPRARRTAASYGRLALAPLDAGGRGHRPRANCERVDFAAGPRPLPRHAGSRRLERRDPRPDLQVGSVRARRRAEPRARLARRPLRRDDGVRDRPLLRRRRPVLDGATIIDMAGGKRRATSRRTSGRAGRQARSTRRDRNFWGVTFSPQDATRFYATLATGGQDLPDRGRASRRTARAIHENVECPSLSPGRDAHRATRSAVGHDPPVWRFHVLDLATMQRDAAGRDRAARRPGRVARRRPRAVRRRRGDLDGAGRRLRRAAALARRGELAVRRAPLSAVRLPGRRSPVSRSGSCGARCRGTSRAAPLREVGGDAL